MNDIHPTVIRFGPFVTARFVDIGGGWIRLGSRGIGLYWKRSTDRLLFSERMGLKKTVSLLGLRIGYLKPFKG